MLQMNTNENQIKLFMERKSAKQVRSRQTVSIILEAAFINIRRLGINVVSTNNISKKAGVSVGTYYQYFPNKEALYIKLYENLMSRIASYLESALLKDHKPSIHLILKDVHNSIDRFYPVIKQLKNEMEKYEHGYLTKEAQQTFTHIIQCFLVKHFSLTDDVALNKTEEILTGFMHFCEQEGSTVTELEDFILQIIAKNETPPEITRF